MKKNNIVTPTNNKDYKNNSPLGGMGGAAFGYIKVASAIPSVKVGDVSYNLQQAEEMIVKAENISMRYFSIFTVLSFHSTLLYYEASKRQRKYNTCIILLNHVE